MKTLRNLASENYTILAAPSTPGLFYIGKPDGTVYETNVLSFTCTCKAALAGRACCHRDAQQIAALIHRQISANIVAMAENEVSQSYIDGLYAENLNLAEAWNTIYAQEVETEETASPALHLTAEAAREIAGDQRWEVHAFHTARKVWVRVASMCLSFESAERKRAGVWAKDSKFSATEVRTVTVQAWKGAKAA